MTLDARALQERLCERLCEAVRVERRPDGALMLLTRFQFPDGDRFPIRLSEAGPGGIRLSDSGHTLMRLSYEHDVDAFFDGTRGALLERILAESGRGGTAAPSTSTPPPSGCRRPFSASARR